jgi:glycerol kinase
MEHYRPDGSLSQGYYCMHCGKVSSTYGTGHYPDKECGANPSLVKALIRANPAPGTKPHFKLKLS